MADQQGSRCGVEFEEVFERELGYVRQRWQTVYEGDNERRLASTSKPTTGNSLVGLAFSGGGIRSATINLGIAQALHERGVFDHVDYMSSVSGGGYLGASISTAMRRLPADKGAFARGKGEFPYAVDFGAGPRQEAGKAAEQRESPFLTWVRNNSNYMATGGFLDFARIGGVLLRGILVNFLVLLPILLVLATALFWRYDSELDDWKEAGEAAAQAELEATDAEATALRLAALAQEIDCGADIACTEQAAAAGEAARTARSAAEKARKAVPPKARFFPLAPLIAACFVFMALLFPVLILIYKVYRHRQLLLTGEESSVSSRSTVEMAFAWCLALIGAVALVEAMPILIHYFHHLRDAGWRGASAGLASGGALAAITVAGKLISRLGGLKQKLLVLAIGLLGLVIPLVVMLYVTEGLVYGVWGAIQTFDVWHPFSAPPMDAAALGPHTKTASAAFWLLPGSLLIILGGGFGSFIVGWLMRTPSKLRAGVSSVVTLAGAALGYYSIHWLSRLLAKAWGEPVPVLVFVLAGAAVVLLFCRLAVDPNLTGVLGLYRDRLASAYLIGLRRTRDAAGKVGEAEEIFIEPDLDLEDICGGTPTAEQPKDPGACPNWASQVTCHASKAPYHIVNTSLNLQGSKDPLLRDRNSDFMMFSKYYYGGHRTGYCTTRDLERVFPQMDLPTAMAISAAAASPNAGRMTSKPLVALLTLFNIRLGYWVPNPGRLCEWLRKKTDRNRQSKPTLWHRFRWRIPPWALLREMFSKVDERHRWVNLSDGGHIENTAVYELLRRRCRYIICGDGEADAGLTFGGLATLMRYARIDMGIEIEILLDDLRLGENGQSSQHSALGRIIYPGRHRKVRQAEGGICPEPDCSHELEEDRRAAKAQRYFCPAGPETGYLLYIKSSFTGNEDETMQEYRAKNADFPHESTADQFFDEGQFEAYRALGYHMADGLFPPLVGGEDPKHDWQGFTSWFHNLRADLAPRLSAKHAYLQDQLRRIQKALVREEYRSYYFELHPGLAGADEASPEADADESLSPEITYMVGQQLALMEHAFVNLNLDQPRNWDHEGNQGWRTLFEQWARSRRFTEAYRYLGQLHSGRFQNFCHRAFGLPDAAELWEIARHESRPTAAAED